MSHDDWLQPGQIPPHLKHQGFLQPPGRRARALPLPRAQPATERPAGLWDRRELFLIEVALPAFPYALIS
jgi:hypothetical protein